MIRDIHQSLQKVLGNYTVVEMEDGSYTIFKYQIGTYSGQYRNEICCRNISFKAATKFMNANTIKRII